MAASAHQSQTLSTPLSLGQGPGWDLWLLLPPAGDLAASPSWESLVLPGGRGMGPQLPRGQLHPCPWPSGSIKKLAGSILPSQQPRPCQEGTKSLPGENRAGSKRPAAAQRGRSPAGQGAFPGPLTCCQGPVRTAPASTLPRVGGSQALTPSPSHSRTRDQADPGLLHSLHGRFCVSHNDQRRRTRPRQNPSAPIPSQNTP